jgi:outer membrane lipoprotein carrier protein
MTLAKLFFSLNFILLFFAGIISAQQDPEAKKILDQFSDKTRLHSAFQATFTILSENHQSNESTENKGVILIKGNKYRIELNDNFIFFNGKEIFNYIPSSNEVSILKPSKKNEDDFLGNPANLFKIYLTDYKFRYLGEIISKNRKCYEVDLYPKELNKKYSIVKMLIDKENFQLVSAKLVMKSGIQYVIQIDNFNGRVNASDKDFNFDVKAHKGIEINDLR